jgi:hypothetical protein
MGVLLSGKTVMTRTDLRRALQPWDCKEEKNATVSTAAQVLFVAFCGIMCVPGETESGTAGTQPDKG